MVFNMTKLASLLIIFCMVVHFPISHAKTQSDDYIRQIQQHRDETDKEFRDPILTSLEEDEISNFKGLSYYEINPSYKVKARFIRTANEKKFDMPTSNGKFKTVVKYGELKFRLADQDLTLSVYQIEKLAQTEEDKNFLHLPFKDLTNGKETYHIGRYIEFYIPESEEVFVDFNLAYNPSCAYNSTGKFSCPLVPQVNYLPVAIRAGEKAYKKSTNKQ